MQKFPISRRNSSPPPAVGGSGLALSGCDVFDCLATATTRLRNFMESANGLTYRVQRLLAGRDALAQEFTEADIRQPQRPNGVTAPDDEIYKGSGATFRRLAARGRRSGREAAVAVARPAAGHALRAPRSPGTIASRAGAASPNGPACRWRWCSTRRR